MPAVGVEPQHTITHAAWRRQPAVAYVQLMNQRVGVDIVESVSRRNVGGLVRKDRGEVRVLAVEVNNVRAKMPLLQEIAAPGEIIDPRPGLVGPRLIAIEPLAERSERESRLFINQRLVRRLMNHNAVDAVDELLVGRGLQRLRR